MKRLALLAFSLWLCCHSASAWSPAGENIRTRWASEVSPENARTEYPRPQMVRPEWKCLNGLWDYAILPESAEYEKADGTDYTGIPSVLTVDDGKITYQVDKEQLPFTTGKASV